MKAINPLNGRIVKASIVLIVILLFAILFYAGVNLRYKYWHFYVHKGLTLFLDREFSELLNRYKKNNNFASIEGKDMKGIIITYPIKYHPRYSVQLRLEKNLITNTFVFRAEISSPEKKSHYDTGTPPVYMEIPMRDFKKVIHDGLSYEQIDLLIRSAEKANWRPVGVNVQENIAPPIILEYKKERNK